uniref:DUF4011 domain-containing protein n=1 Tax=Gemmatimonas sp. TaxID=1962908 RepID=UPI003563741D
MSESNEVTEQLLDSLLEQLGEGPSRTVVGHSTVSVAMELSVLDTLTFSLVQAGVSPVRMLTIANTGASVIPPSTIFVRLECATVDSIAGETQFELPPIEPGAVIRFSKLDIAPNPATLVSLNESVPGCIRAELKIGDELIAWTEDVVQIMAYNEFYNSTELLEIIAAHVLPNHPAITPVLQRASALLQERTGSPSIEGYQSGPKRALEIAEAVYVALQEMAIVYINPPASFEDSGQKVRTPDQVLGERLGTCLDLACTYAACIEQAGLNPAIYFVHGHAYAGVFTSEEASATETAALLDHDSVVNLEDSALLVPLESVAFTAGEIHSFSSAISLGRGRLRADGALKSLVSIWRARRDGIRPLPSRVVRDGQITVIVQEAPAPTATIPTVARPPLSRGVAAPRPDLSPARLRRWKADLLDLSLRNPLLQMSTRTTLELLAAEGSVGLFEDLLANGSAVKLVANDELTALHRERGARSAADIDREVRHHLLAENQLIYVDCDTAKLRTRLRSLITKARTAEEETGTNILHLAIGSLRWNDPKTNRAVRSPVLLIPVRLRSAGRGKPVEMVIDPTGAPTHNYCLLQKLRSTFDL